MVDTPAHDAEWVPTQDDGKKLHEYYLGKLKDIVLHPENYPLDALSQVMDALAAVNDLLDGNYDEPEEEDGPGQER